MRGSRRNRRGVWLAAAVGSIVLGVSFIAGAATPPDFVDEAVFTGLSNPTNIEFAANGKVFIAEKSGIVKVYDSVTDATPDTFADLRSNVHDYWDRGLLGLAVHPDFPAQPYVYVLYTYGVPLFPGTQTWGDTCPDPTGEGCVVSGRLSRLTASGNQMTGSEAVLIEDWCQQYPSHSIGDLEFGPDGALYASAGDGASFTFADWGQGGNDDLAPPNPCGDPPVPIGGTQVSPQAEGGALRSQDLETSGDPVTLDGTLIRIDPLTGAAAAGNPAIGASDPNEQRIVAYGLRNPFRIAIDENSGAVYAGDVGWGTWEEVNEHPNPQSTVMNFGWPCYEGGSGVSNVFGSYSALDICTNLYSAGTADASLFAYRHNQDITGDDLCRPANPPQGTSSSISGLDFYPGGDYPGTYIGALFGSDYSRDCIWVMFRDGNGDLDPSSIEIFQTTALNPVDVEAGPNGDIYYANLNGGEVRRFRFVGTNTPPVAVMQASPLSGPAPLAVDFDGTQSSDPDEDPIVLYEWDLDGDGQYDDAVGAQVSYEYSNPGSYTARLRVTDSRGETDTDSTSIQASNTAPTATINLPAPSLQWHVGETISFSGGATDPEEGSLPPSALSWALILHHCELDGSCHTHGIETFDGVSSGSFVAPDHEYPSWLELRLTAKDQFDVTDVATVEIQPETVDVTFDTDPAGLDVSFFGESETAPIVRTSIVGATIEFSTSANQGSWVYQGWSNGGPRSQSIPTPGVDTTYTATFDEPPSVISNTSVSVPENQTSVTDVQSSDNKDSEGSGLSYGITGGPDSSLFDINSSSGVLTFNSPPDHEDPDDAGSNNVYVFDVTVTDSAGLSDTEQMSVTVTNVNEMPTASNDGYSGDEDQVIASGAPGVLDNDSDIEGSQLIAGLVSGPSVGSLDLDSDGSFDFTPPNDWFGQTSFVYEACDPGSLCDQATVTLTVGAVNDPPTAGDDTSTSDEDQIVVIDVTANDSDLDGTIDLSTVQIVSQPSTGTASEMTDGTIVFTPDADWSGSDQLTYTVKDNSGAVSNAAVVSIDVNPVNDPPVAVDDSKAIDEDLSTTVSVLANDTDIDNALDEGSVELVAAPMHGSAVVDAFGVFSYTPDPNWNGVDSFTYRVADESGALSNAATVTVTVNPVNDPPVADAGPDREVEVGQTAQLDGSGSADPLDGDPITYQWQIVSAPAGSSVGIADGDQALASLTPDEPGTYTIELEVSDGSDTATDTVVVEASEVLSEPVDTFLDDDDSIFEFEIEWLASTGITKGCNPPDNDLFCPDDYVTRGQFAAFSARAFGWTDVGEGDLFIDDDGHLFEHEIDLMGTAGVTKGCNPPLNSLFCPNDIVTRGQMAAFFARAFGWTDVGAGDLFIDDDGHLFEHEIDLMGTAGVTKGCNPPLNNRFCPDDYVTRGQIAAFFYRAFNK